MRRPKIPSRDPVTARPNSAIADKKRPSVIMGNFHRCSACLIQNICKPYAGIANIPIKKNQLCMIFCAHEFWSTSSR